MPQTSLKSTRGFSLIEIMFALAIVSVVLALAIPRLQTGMRVELRSSSRKISSTIHYAYNEAITKNRYFRMMFSMDPTRPDSFWLEVSDRPFFVRTVEQEEDLRRRLTYLSEKDRKLFEQSQAVFERVTEHEKSDVLLPKGVRFRNIFVAHQKEPLDTGTAVLNFFPNGQTEFAFINLEDEEGNAFSIVVSPLTGKTMLRQEWIENEAQALQL